MLLTTEQHARLAAFYAREAEDAKHGPELREKLKRKRQLFGVCAILSAEPDRKVASAVAYKLIYSKYPWDDLPDAEARVRWEARHGPVI
jgi:hypothetical protein